MMAQYQLTQSEHILRLNDQVWIPPDPANRDYAEYLDWLAAGNEPDSYVPPPSPPVSPTVEDLMKELQTLKDQIAALQK
jgi:hypothetical protein